MNVKDVIDVLPPWLLPLLAGLIGAILGSFANVCIFRMPRGESLVRPASHCPLCGHWLAWWENIPLVSFVLLRGRCHFCREPISWQYPLVELLCIILSILTWRHFGDPLRYGVFFCLFIVPLVVASVIDLYHYIIPDSISIPGIAVGMVAHQFLGGLEAPEAAVFDSIVGIIAGGGILYIVAAAYEKIKHREGLGGGDVKLMAMLGAFFGWKAAFVILFTSSLLGSVVGIFLILFFRRGMRHAIAFGPYIAAAGILYLFLGEKLVETYVGLFSF